MQRSMRDLHFLFTFTKWDGVAAFAAVIVRRELGRWPLQLISDPCAGIEGVSEVNELYTVRDYLSDLFSRRNRMSEEDIRYINDTFGSWARILATAKITRVI